jgi:hypothetical protein
MGLINPFWIAVNMLLRATNLAHCIPPPIDTQSIIVTLPPSSFFTFAGSTVGTWVSVGLLIVGYVFADPALLIAGLVMLIGSAFTGNAFSVPMSNAANQAEVLLQQNLQHGSISPRFTRRRRTRRSSSPTSTPSGTPTCRLAW